MDDAERSTVESSFISDDSLLLKDLLGPQEKSLRSIFRISGWILCPLDQVSRKDALLQGITPELHNFRERKTSPKFFRPKFFHGRPRGTSVRKCLFFQDLEGLTEVFGRMSAGISGPKLPLWAEFSFLKFLERHNHLGFFVGNALLLVVLEMIRC